MSEHETMLPPLELPTAPDHAIPSELPQFDIDNSDAPEWAKALYHQNEKRREEEAAFLDRLEKNQRFQLREIRRVSGRVSDHDAEIRDLRERVEDLEDWRESTDDDDQ